MTQTHKHDPLSHIPPYVLCADGKTSIPFRPPYVADYRAFCGLPSELEEHATTDWLNRLMLTEQQNSANWTAQDRRTALYWIYIHVKDSTVVTQEYECEHCGQLHGRQLDLISLSRGINTASVQRVPIAVEAVRPGSIVPLNGHAMPWLEIARLQRDEHTEGSPEFEAAHADLRIKEVAAALRFDDYYLQSMGEISATSELPAKPSSPVDELESNYQYLLTLELTVFGRLAAQVALAMREMDHGLESVYRDGEVSLVTPAHACPVKEEAAAKRRAELLAENVPEADWPAEIKEGNTASTRLLLGFHCYPFFPNL